ncbi:MAG: DUF92 domain-containing protein [Terracidiphilus sp.]
MDPTKLAWQSKLVLLLVLPAVAADVAWQAYAQTIATSPVVVWTFGLSALLGLVAWKVRSATPAAAATGALLTASLMFSTASQPYIPWQTNLVPLVVLLVLTALATRLGRRRKEQLGTAERPSGRTSSQVAANLGVATLFTCQVAQSWQMSLGWLHLARLPFTAAYIAGLAALCEAAADTVSSELGQVLSGSPRMITTFRVAAPGTDGAISLGGTLAGVIAAGIVATAGTLALRGDLFLFAVSWIASVFGLCFDSLLGATLERSEWLNNDAVNFLSTASAAACALVLVATIPNLVPSTLR